MDSESSLPPPFSTIDKGKGRAPDSTERTPLLLRNDIQTSSSSGRREDGDLLIYSPTERSRSARRRLAKTLSTVFLFSFGICILVVGVVGMLAWSYASKAANVSPEKILNEDVVVSGPFSLDILNTTDDGAMWLKVSLRMGVDAGDAIGVNSPDEPGNMFDELWKAIGRWSIRKLESVTLELSTVTLVPEYDVTLELVELEFPLLQVPLTVDPPKSLEWLTPMTTEVLVRPTKSVSVLKRFVKESWKHGSFNVQARVPEAAVYGGHEVTGWKAKMSLRVKNIQTSIHVDIPSLPGLPSPGTNIPFPSISDLLTLTSFRISSQKNLTLHAETSIINPLPKSLGLSIPSLPFTVSLPNENNSGTNYPKRINVANVLTQPCQLTHPNITLLLSGTVPAIQKSSFPLLSSFLSRYLNEKPNQIIVSTPLFSGLEISTEFPSPKPRPKLLRDVTIKDMKIKPIGTTFVASGVVFAKVVLPEGIDVGVDVFRVFPDVLIFDGEVPDDVHGTGSTSVGIGIRTEVGMEEISTKTSPPKSPELPNPLPERAFGHIKPDDWLPSTSIRLEAYEEDGDNWIILEPGDEERRTGAVYAVSAQVVDVPLQVLPGRQKEFSNFVGKVIFGSGAVAGIQGHAAVTVEVDGLPIENGNHQNHNHADNEDDEKNGAIVELTGLPFRGSVKVGKKGL